MFGKVIGKRLLFSAFILIAVSLLVFGATLLLPGDAARAILGQQATPERIAALNEQLGLNDPAWLRYFHLAGRALRRRLRNLLGDRGIGLRNSSAIGSGRPSSSWGWPRSSPCRWASASASTRPCTAASAATRR
jgi:hypothetical protein